MKKYRILPILIALILMPSTRVGVTMTDATLSNREVAKQIKQTYSENLQSLNPKIRAHYAARMYRISGDMSYVKHIAPYARTMTKKIKKYLRYWDTTGYKEKVAIDAMASWPNSQKNRRRIAILSKRLDYVFYRSVLEKTYQLYSYNMAGKMGKDYDQVIKHFSEVKWEDLLLNPELIKEFASKLANYCNYLKLMGIVDLEDEYIRVFRKVFMNSKDSALTKIEYQNKIYGLTHIILASTGYLQQDVPAKKYTWILDYFEKNIEEIISRTKVDVIAEVGLCFTLCGRKNHKVVALTQQCMVDAFDPKQGLIPFGKRKVNLRKSEHRNIIAYLLLTDFKKFYPGPDLNKKKSAHPQEKNALKKQNKKQKGHH